MRLSLAILFVCLIGFAVAQTPAQTPPPGTWTLIKKETSPSNSHNKVSGESNVSNNYESDTFCKPPTELEIGQTYTLTVTRTAVKPPDKPGGSSFGWRLSYIDAKPHSFLPDYYFKLEMHDGAYLDKGRTSVTHTEILTPIWPVQDDATVILYSFAGMGPLTKYTYQFKNGEQKHKTVLEAVDCHLFDPTGTQRLIPLDHEPGDRSVSRLAREKSQQPLRGVVADGVSLVLLRSEAPEKCKATFSVLMARGKLYPLVSDPFRRKGESTVDADTRRLDDKHHVAFALYRPPTSFGSEGGKTDLQFKVEFHDENGKTIGEGERTISLMRPPVVLVHGTYDGPKQCYQTIEAGDDSSITMERRLLNEGMRPFIVDWESSNGSKDPSDFITNDHAVYKNPGGILQAINTYRSNGTAITQVDVVCHSQGGVIARVYARGFQLSEPMSTDHPHFTDPDKCAGMRCWYHRSDNYNRGDIHRLITISSTHRGSDVCRLFVAYEKYSKEHSIGPTVGHILTADWLDLFRSYVNEAESGIITGGFYDQVPASPHLQAIGPTPVPSHALACVADDQDVQTGHGGSYYNRLWKIWKATPAEAMIWSFENLSPANKFNDANGLENLLKTKADTPEIISDLRAGVFDHDENDVTVAKMSSFGGLGEKYRDRMPHVLHGWAPRYRSIQERVVELLKGDGDDFDANGFPDSYTSARANVIGFTVDADTGKTGSTGPASFTDSSAPPPAGGTTVGANETPGGGGGTVAGWDLAKLADAGWSKPESDEGKVSFEDGRVVLDVPKDSQGGLRTFAEKPLNGDFDLNFDFTLKDWHPGPKSTPSFDIYISPEKDIGATTIQITRASTPGQEMVFVMPAMAQIPAVLKGDGKIRVQRTGIHWLISQWDGRSWSKVGSFELQMPRAVHVGFGLGRNGLSSAKVAIGVTTGG